MMQILRVFNFQLEWLDLLVSCEVSAVPSAGEPQTWCVQGQEASALQLQPHWTSDWENN